MRLPRYIYSCIGAFTFATVRLLLHTTLRLLKARESGHSLCHPRSPVFFLQRRKAKKAPTETAGVLRRLRLRCPTARKSEPSCTSCPSCSPCLRWLRTPVPRGASSASLILRTFVRPPSRVAALPRSSLPLPPFSLPLLPIAFPLCLPSRTAPPLRLCVSAAGVSAATAGDAPAPARGRQRLPAAQIFCSGR